MFVCFILWFHFLFGNSRECWWFLVGIFCWVWLLILRGVRPFLCKYQNWWFFSRKYIHKYCERDFSFVVWSLILLLLLTIEFSVIYLRSMFDMLRVKANTDTNVKCENATRNFLYKNLLKILLFIYFVTRNSLFNFSSLYHHLGYHHSGHHHSERSHSLLP